MYHHVAPPEAIPPAEKQLPIEGWQFTHSPEAFRGELEKLSARGFRFVPMEDLVKRLRGGHREDPREVVVTFDDGWVDNHRYALPILKELKIPATFFIASDYIAEKRRDPRKMTPEQLRELYEAGMSLGGHTRSHPDLTKVTAEQAREEIRGCKDDLEKVVGVPARFFAYPGGAFNREIARMVREAGYSAACSVIGGGRNSERSLFWLYRTVLSEPFDCLRNRVFLSPLMGGILTRRAEKRVRQTLG
jgi:peptidoglycan/xylan/chitin deacetylase (PgdA/CDA1 family)